MKFHVDRAQFADAVAWVARSLPQRPSMPVLSGILLTIEPEQATVSSFDYEISTQMKIAADVETAGKALVSGRLLSDITKSLPDQPVHISVDGSRLTLTCGSSKFTLPTMPVEDYPSLPQMPELAGQVSSDEFAKVISTVAVAAGRDETLPMLTGVRVEIDGANLTFAATDRYRLAVREMQWQPTSDSVNTAVLIPARMLSDTARTLAGSGDVTIALSDQADGLIGFSGGDRHTTTRLLDPDFPPFRKLLPTESEATAELDVHALIDAVRRVSLVAERGTPVQLAFDEGSCTLTVAGEDEGSAEESVSAEFTGEPLRIGFNPTYLLDGLGAISSQQVRMSFLSSTKPAVLSPVTDDDSTDSFRYLIMPMRLPN